MARIIDWVDERLDLSDIRHFIAEKGVPIHTQKIWYYLGGMTLFLFAGAGRQRHPAAALLPAERRRGLRKRPVHRDAGGVRLAHSQHPQLVGESADPRGFAHLFSVFFLKAYRKPRELTWITGVLLLFVMLGFGFSGYLLPWNELAFFATKVGTGIAGAVPLIGGAAHAISARRRRCDRRDAVALLRAARRDSAGDDDAARRRTSALRAAPGHERADSDRAADEAGRARQADAVLPRLHPARCAPVVRRHRPARGSGGVLSLGARAQGRRVRAGAAGHSAGVVLPRDVSHAEAPAEPHPRNRGRSGRGRRRSVSPRSACCSCRFSIGAPPEDEPSPLFTALGIGGLVYFVALTIIGHLAS